MRHAAIDEVLVQEFHAERAAALARANRRYLQAWDRMRLLESDPEAEEQDWLASRARFRTARWELMVTREALGLRSHHDMDQQLHESGRPSVSPPPAGDG
jgi:hypothetical protein